MINVSRLFVDAISRRQVAQIAVLTIAAGVTGCAQPPQVRHSSNGREYFSQAKYGHASPRVIGDGQAVPHGGGQYLVGHAYTIAGHTYYPSENESYTAVGMASWYGDAFQGRRTANGEIYDKESISAAHPTMPLPSYARVTNLGNGHSIIVRVNDRGPYHGGRVMDVSSRVADALDFKGAGTAHVKVEYIGRAALEGSDDSKLLATLRLDGAPATLDGAPDGSPVMMASNSNPVASLAKALTPAPARPQPPAPPAPEPAPAAPMEALAEPAKPLPIHAPTPPARPFDLGTIPDAAVPVTAVRSSEMTPPPRPKLQTAATDNALYFADSASVRMFMRHGGPFDRLKAQGFVPLSKQP
ncbi:septal ring lytic transglycosylase RlpA family protein [Methylocapsa sp. S129]|uniref:septal ring lytic transglycosylase RlpA family protein n=1 Tax=Methylocapsa sp. S129 TaxID=1641869 RepID=UPI00131CC457|nr:septal ring lytic transglycosylase RlpA family protein [Methylocapsa sp. S129]